MHLYVHIPFCAKKCRYCSFYSVVAGRDVWRRYLDALRLEIELVSEKLRGRCGADATIYIGGGTPSLLAPEQIEGILGALRRNFRIENAVEVTVEANPESFCESWGRELVDVGANRISIGAQALDDNVLRFLGRIHSARQAKAALEAAAKAGFDEISADIIYGIPGQTTDDILRELEEITWLPHISLYSLTVDPGTGLWRLVEDGTVRMPSQDEVAEQYYAAFELLSERGFRAYEVSNFAKPGHECRHNLGYWLREEYVGLGAGAWSFVGGVRWRNVACVESYIAALSNRQSPVDFREKLSPNEAFEEWVMLSLRLEDGLDVARAGHLAEALFAAAEPLIKAGLLVKRGTRLLLPPHKRLLADGVAAEIVARIEKQKDLLCSSQGFSNPNLSA